MRKPADINALQYILAPGDKLMVVAGKPPTHYEDVAAFHEKFGVPCHINTPLGLPLLDVWEFRYKFLNEELAEAHLAWEKRDFQKFLDALLDLVYVAYGTALMAGVSPELWDKLWQTVQEANMAKVRASSAEDSYVKTGRGSAFDVVKPDGWVSPDAKQKQLIQEALLRAFDDPSNDGSGFNHDED